MNSFSKAVASMSGSSTCKSTFTADEVIDIINVAIQLMENREPMKSAEKLMELRASVNDGNYSKYNLKNITGCAASDDDLLGDVKLSDIQLTRFRELHPIAYIEYKNHNNRPFVQKVMDTIAKDFQELPKSKLVYKSARNSQEYWNNYINTSWTTYEENSNISYAWIYAYGGVHLLCFVSNIFKCGVRMDDNWQVKLCKLHSDGDTVHITSDKLHVDFKAVKNNDRYDLIVDGVKVMDIDRYVLVSVCMLMRDGYEAPEWELKRIDDGLIRGDKE